MSKALQSKAFSNAYLRIDGTGVGAPASGGGGIVNCQSGVADFEVIEERPQPDGTIALASVSFPNVFLRMDGSDVRSASDRGAGTVNCQFGVGAWEKFLLLEPPFSTVRWRSAPGSEESPHQDMGANQKAFQTSDYDSDSSVVTDTDYLYSHDSGGGTSTADFDFVATSSVGTSPSLGVSPQVGTEHSQALAEAGSVDLRKRSRAPIRVGSASSSTGEDCLRVPGLAASPGVILFEL